MQNCIHARERVKQELLSLIKLSNPKPKYAIDEMAKAAGHEGSIYSTIPLWTESSQAKLVASETFKSGIVTCSIIYITPKI